MSHSQTGRLPWLIACLAATQVAAVAQNGGSDADTLAGHSLHGDAFNEGPRQKAHLMEGAGHSTFPVTTASPMAQKFFHQGVGQIHGFWYFEAERSFRQVLALDTNCAMAYWGMAMANINNTKRAKDFIQRAAAAKAKASPREQAYIEGLAAYHAEGKRDEKERRRELAASYEKISKDYPDDLEAKAFLAFQVWDNASRIPIPDTKVADSLMKQILTAEPMHSVHHYRIHLWDGKKASEALNSAAACGQSSPAIAHMWHMPGHTFSKLFRYSDAAWQQEASARVDHSHMMHDRVLPDQIHNYAHNNEWLIRDLSFIGRVHDAEDLARNMIILPRHPKYNTLARRGTSASYGRARLFDILQRWELWDELIALSQTFYLEPTDLPDEQIKRWRALGTAFFNKGDLDGGKAQIEALEAFLANKNPLPVGTESGARGRGGSSTNRTAAAEAALTDLRALQALRTGNLETARQQISKIKDASKERLALLQWDAGDRDKAEQLAREAVNGATNQVQILATYVDILFRKQKYEEAFRSFFKLRDLCGQADLDVPALKRLQPVARLLKLPTDWRPAPPRPTDVGKRPDLNKLGPFRWHPMPAPEWTLADGNGRAVSSRNYRGKPMIMIFYLGAGCPHCIEQLNAFAPMTGDFTQAGISMVAVGTDSAPALQKTGAQAKGGGGFPFPLLADNNLKTFKAFRAYDDFENMPLHGIFLIDGDGLVRWQDISYQPFVDAKFLLEESRRLLGQPKDRPEPFSLRLAAR
jgi:peroxiredoxin